MNKKIGINLWDDFYDDGYIPEGKSQHTYMYVESSVGIAFQYKFLKK